MNLEVRVVCLGQILDADIASQDTGSNIPRCDGLFFVDEESKIQFLPGVLDRCAPSPFAEADADMLPAYGSIPCVLLLGDNPKIVAPIVERVTVDVVYDHLIGGVYQLPVQHNGAAIFVPRDMSALAVHTPTVGAELRQVRIIDFDNSLVGLKENFHGPNVEQTADKVTSDSPNFPRVLVPCCAYVRLSVPERGNDIVTYGVENAKKIWCCERGLNSRPLPYQGNSQLLFINGLRAVTGQVHGFFTDRPVVFPSCSAGDENERPC